VSEQTIILIGVCVYMLAMLGVGIYAGKKTVNADDFMVAGRSLPLWLCCGSVMATWLGGGSMLGVSGLAYEGGLLAVIADPFGAAVGLILVGLLVVRLLRRLRLLTVIDFIENRFGRAAAVFSAIGMVSSSIGWSGALMVAFGSVFHVLTGLSMELGIVIGGAVVLVYTAVGGMWAVALTDFVQLLIIILGLIVLLAAVVAHLGGWDAVWSDIEPDTLRMTPYESDPATWLNYLRAWFIIGLASLSSQSLLQRGLSARNERVAQNAFYIGGIGFLAIALIPVLLGIVARVALPGVDSQDTIIPMLAMEHLHPVLMSVFVGALLAAIMSSADSALLSASSVLSNNILPVVWPRAARTQKLIWARASIPVMGVIAVIIAWKVQSIYGLILATNEILLAAVVVPFVLGIWWKASNRIGALSAMTVAVVVWMSSKWLRPDLPGDLLGMAACLLTMLIVTPLTQRVDPPRPLLTADGEEIEFRDRLGILR
jgi:SSS family solute:Na+ symporter